jgi:hypothetical protein
MYIAHDLARAHTDERLREAQLERQARRIISARRARRRAERAACRAREAALQASLAQALL